VWDLLVDELIALDHDERLRLSPLGFRSRLPEGWGATVLDSGSWLAGELERIGELVDLGGHDWGGYHVMGVAMNRPDLIRTWVSDAARMRARSPDGRP